MAASTTTLDDALQVDRARLHRGMWWRRAGTAFLALLVVAALTGWLGVRSATKQASDGRLKTQLQYASITRRGVPTPWQMEIRRRGGFSNDVTVYLSRSYLAQLDPQGVSPQPDSESTSGDAVVWTFSQPPGNDLVVRLDAEASPAAAFGRHRAHASVIVGDEKTDMAFTTWMMP